MTGEPRWRLSDAHGLVLMFGDDRWLEATLHGSLSSANVWTRDELLALVERLNADPLDALLRRFVMLRMPDALSDEPRRWAVIDTHGDGMKLSVQGEAAYVGAFTNPEWARAVRDALNDHPPPPAIPDEEPF